MKFTLTSTDFALKKSVLSTIFINKPKLVPASLKHFFFAICKIKIILQLFRKHLFHAFRLARKVDSDEVNFFILS